MKALANVNGLGLSELREEELMAVNGGDWKVKLIKYAVKVIIDGVVYETFKYVAKKIWVSDYSPSLPPNLRESHV